RAGARPRGERGVRPAAPHGRARRADPLHPRRVGADPRGARGGGGGRPGAVRPPVRRAHRSDVCDPRQRRHAAAVAALRPTGAHARRRAGARDRRPAVRVRGRGAAPARRRAARERPLDAAPVARGRVRRGGQGPRPRRRALQPHPARRAGARLRRRHPAGRGVLAGTARRDPARPAPRRALRARPPAARAAGARRPNRARQRRALPPHRHSARAPLVRPSNVPAMADAATSSITIAAPPERVMDVIADFRAYPEWAEQVKSVEVLSSGEDGRAQRVRFTMDAGPIKDSYTLDYTWDPGGRSVSWTLVKGQIQKAQHGSYTLAEAPEGTTVTYSLAVDLNIPMIGMLRRKAEKVIIDTALKGLKRRVESLS